MKHIGFYPGSSVTPAEERMAMLRAETAPIATQSGTPIDIVSFAGLAGRGAPGGGRVIVRGLRDAFYRQTSYFDMNSEVIFRAMSRKACFSSSPLSAM